MKRCPSCGQAVPNQYLVVCNDDSRCIMYDGRVSDRLAGLEYEAVKYLVQHFGKFRTANAIGDWLYQLNLEPPDDIRNCISSYLSRARKKLRPLGLAIDSVQGSNLGWRICREQDRTSQTSRDIHQSAH